MLASTMSKKDRAKLLAGLADIDAEDLSLDGELTSRISPDGSLSERSDRRGFNSLMLDFKDEHQHEMQGLWTAIQKLEREKMDKNLCEKSLRKLRRKVEEELGSLGESTDPEATGTVVTPGGTVIESPEASRGGGGTKGSRTSEGRGGSKSGGALARQGVDVDALKDILESAP